MTLMVNDTSSYPNLLKDVTIQKFSLTSSSNVVDSSDSLTLDTGSWYTLSFMAASATNDNTTIITVNNNGVQLGQFSIFNSIAVPYIIQFNNVSTLKNLTFSSNSTTVIQISKVQLQRGSFDSYASISPSDKTYLTRQYKGLNQDYKDLLQLAINTKTDGNVYSDVTSAYNELNPLLANFTKFPNTYSSAMIPSSTGNYSTDTTYNFTTLMQTFNSALSKDTLTINFNKLSSDLSSATSNITGLIDSAKSLGLDFSSATGACSSIESSITSIINSKDGTQLNDAQLQLNDLNTKAQDIENRIYIYSIISICITKNINATLTITDSKGNLQEVNVLTVGNDGVIKLLNDLSNTMVFNLNIESNNVL